MFSKQLLHIIEHTKKNITFTELSCQLVFPIITIKLFHRNCYFHPFDSADESTENSFANQSEVQRARSFHAVLGNHVYYVFMFIVYYSIRQSEGRRHLTKREKNESRDNGNLETCVITDQHESKLMFTLCYVFRCLKQNTFQN